MPRNNSDPTDKPAGLALEDESCPKCGTDMEPIDIAVEGLPLRQLRLCPRCYLVTWMDDSGFQTRQGVPMKKGQPSKGWAGKPN
jgi:ribosomal protein S27AE